MLFSLPTCVSCNIKPMFINIGLNIFKLRKTLSDFKIFVFIFNTSFRYQTITFDGSMIKSIVEGYLTISCRR